MLFAARDEQRLRVTCNEPDRTISTKSFHLSSIAKHSYINKKVNYPKDTVRVLHTIEIRVLHQSGKAV